MRLARLSFIVTILIFITSAAPIFAQEFMLNGVIFENGSKIRIALSEVHNTRNKYSVGSNDMGLFSIRAVIGDTLIISKRGFTDKTVAVTSTKDLVVQLNRSVTDLNEVVINGQGKKQALDDIKKEFRNKGSFYAGKPPVLSYFFSPLTAIYELFGRTPNNARRFNNMYANELKNNQVDQLFNKTTINQNTGLAGKELENFMVNYRPDYEKAKNWTVYDATKWIRDSYKEYTDTLKKN
ncbi:MAG: hypothetical protein EOP00_11055 [Pedobacter sp.]|nr:MAG: hypothetical protein EOP00_11055 [Pedobacter sp.]